MKVARGVVFGLLFSVSGFWLPLAVLVAHGQAAVEKTAAIEPQLSDVQKLSLMTIAKDVEIATLKLDAAKVALQRLIDSVVPAGYELTDKLELVKKPIEKKPQS